MRLIIAGKRDYNNKNIIYTEIDKFIIEYGFPTEIIEGGADGVDKLAHQYAVDNKIFVKTFEANWLKLGKIAGPLRNKQMAEYASKDKDAWLLAFWDGQSKGTKSMINEARKKNLNIQIIYI